MALLAASTVTCLVYVFGGNGPRSSLVPSPHMGTGGSSSSCGRPTDPNGNGCRSVDLKADYVRAFGHAPGLLLGVAVSSDFGDTRRQTARSCAACASAIKAGLEKISPTS